MGNAIKKDVIHAEGIDIGIYTSDYENEFISLTDIAKKREGEYPGYVIQNWMRNRSVISSIGLWEALHNPNFNCLEFEAIKNEAGDNGFVITPSVSYMTATSIPIRVSTAWHHILIVFNFPMPVQGQEIKSLPLESESTVETVVLMSRKYTLGRQKRRISGHLTVSGGERI